MQTQIYCTNKNVEYCADADVEICTFVKNPFPDCYCKSITSTIIPKVIAVCGDNFSSCPIYQRESVS